MGTERGLAHLALQFWGSKVVVDFGLNVHMLPYSQCLRVMEAAQVIHESMVTRESKDGQEKKCSGLRGTWADIKKKKRTKDLGGGIELFLAETRDTGI